MLGKSVHAPGLLGESLSDTLGRLLEGHTVEFVILAMIVSTLCARYFSGANRR